MRKTLFRLIFTALVLFPLCAGAIEPAKFNVATYNIRQLNDGDVEKGNGWERRCPVLSSLVRFHGFDIFGTQEGFKSQLEDLKVNLPGYDYIGVAREDGKEEGEHSAIFYNTELFEVIDHGDFWLSETPEKPGLGWDAACVRICTWGHFRHKPSGRDFLFFNLHMDHVGKKARVESAKLIKHKIDELGSTLPTFLTGDFNVDQFSPSYQTIIEGGKLLDSHDVADFVYEPNGTFNSYRTDRFTRSRIDHIFVSPNVKVEKYGILTDTYRTPVANAKEEKGENAPREMRMRRFEARTPSDHFPVKTVVELK